MRFLMQSLALALVGYWASEALFWGFRQFRATR